MENTLTIDYERSEEYGWMVETSEKSLKAPLIFETLKEAQEWVKRYFWAHKTIIERVVISRNKEGKVMCYNSPDEYRRTIMTKP